jgi:hypothetical protein
MRWTNSCSFYIITIKMFITVWPMVNLAFVQKFVDATCKSDKTSVLNEVYKATGFPPNIENPTGDTTWADPFFFETPKFDGVCMYGCIPTRCQPQGVEGTMICETNCVVEIEETLATLFVIQLVATLFFVLVPILILKLTLMKERRDAGIAADRHYSMLQLQAKRSEVTPYTYNSWGGSFIEDFTDVAVAFMTLVSFGNAVPNLAFGGFLCYLVLYRLFAYRMVLVTGRPYPQPSNGIGIWQSVFETSGFLAVVINVGYLVTVEYPFRNALLADQILSFLVLEHLVVTLRFCVKSISPHEPDGVRLNRYVNNSFVEKMTSVSSRLMVPKEEKYNVDAVHKSLMLKPSPTLGSL